ncbi:MAG: ankyrin repeat domain-containing protein [Coxiellaceae bacterium]|nr:MAG: ankyrin repeat domain-containing protein [Coxiellaceae bacterium]
MQLIEAIINDNTDVIEDLLNAGTDPNMKVDDGLTPLHFAAAYNAIHAAAILIDAGAKLYLLDDNGEAPYDVAKSCGHEEMALLLIDDFYFNSTRCEKQ